MYPESISWRASLFVHYALIIIQGWGNQPSIWAVTWCAAEPLIMDTQAHWHRRFKDLGNVSVCWLMPRLNSTRESASKQPLCGPLCWGGRCSLSGGQSCVAARRARAPGLRVDQLYLSSGLAFVFCLTVSFWSQIGLLSVWACGFLFIICLHPVCMLHAATSEGLRQVLTNILEALSSLWMYTNFYRKPDHTDRFFHKLVQCLQQGLLFLHLPTIRYPFPYHACCHKIPITKTYLLP